MSSVAGVINKCVSCVAEAYRFFVRGKVGCTGSGYRRGEVRSEYQGVAFSVKEFIKFFGWDGSYFAAEYFKVFECRGFYVFIAILVEDAMDFLLYLFFSGCIRRCRCLLHLQGCGKYAAWVVLLLVML